MKKVSLLVACVAALLVLGTMSFAAEEAACVSAAPAACECGAVPFVYPPASHKLFGNRLAMRSAPEAVTSESAEAYAGNRRDARRAARNVPYFVVAPPVAVEECEAETGVKAPVIEFNFLSAVRGAPRYAHPIASDNFAAVAGQGGLVKAPIVNFNFLSAVRGSDVPPRAPRLPRGYVPPVCTCPQ